MNREQLLAEAEALAGPHWNFPAGGRERFDEIVRQLEASHPRAQPEIVRGDDLASGVARSGIVRSAYAPSFADDAMLLDDEPTAAPVLADPRSAVLAQLDAIEAAGGYTPIVVAGTARTAGSLRTFVQACPHGFLSDVQVQLDAIAARTATTRPNTDHTHRIADDLAVARDLELIADANAHAEYQNSDAGRHARLERLLSEIRDRLPEARR